MEAKDNVKTFFKKNSERKKKLLTQTTPTIASKTIFPEYKRKNTFLNSRKLRKFMASLPSIQDIAKGSSSE